VRDISWARFTSARKASLELSEGLHDSPVLIGEFPILSFQAVDSMLERRDVFRRLTGGSRLVKNRVQLSVVAISNSDVPAQGVIEACGLNYRREGSIGKVGSLEAAVGRCPDGEGLSGRYARYQNSGIHYRSALSICDGSQYRSSAPLPGEALCRQYQGEQYSKEQLNLPFAVHNYRCPPDDDL